MLPKGQRDAEGEHVGDSLFLPPDHRVISWVTLTVNPYVHLRVHLISGVSLKRQELGR